MLSTRTKVTLRVLETEKWNYSHAICHLAPWNLLKGEQLRMRPLLQNLDLPATTRAEEKKKKIMHQNSEKSGGRIANLVSGAVVTPHGHVGDAPVDVHGGAEEDERRRERGAEEEGDDGEEPAHVIPPRLPVHVPPVLAGPRSGRMRWGDAAGR